jgi:ABC-type transport system involved in multi-copper enzyme maturation permease subunit
MFDSINSNKIKTVIISFFILSLVGFSIVNLFQSNLYKHRILHFDGMTHQAYKFTFLKGTYTPKELKELQLMFSPPNYEARRNGKRDE